MSEFVQQAINATDGHTITARVFVPQDSVKGGVLIVPAIGVPQIYYAPFAAWLARHGWRAMTFDYRGIGLSRAGSLRSLDVDILGWARCDCAAALDALAAGTGAKPIHWVGHSLGGQIIPFVPNRDRITKIVTIAAGSGYWRENSPPLNRRAWFLWYVVAPVAVTLFGYFPGARLRIVGDLPAGVMQQWRRWCLHPEYAVGAEGDGVQSLYASVTTPMVSLSFTDDEFMSARNTESLHGFYEKAPRTMKRLAPQDIGVRRIGHFGFFRPEFENSLWQPHLLPELS